MVPPKESDAPQDSIQSIYASTAKYYRMLLKAYRILGVNLEKWRARAIARLPDIESPRILDVGVGTGANLLHLIDRYPGYAEVVGVDYTAEMLARAQRKVKDHGWKNVHLVECDAREMRNCIRDDFDLIVSTYSLSIIPNSLLVLDEIRAMTGKSGYILLLDCQKFKGLLRLFNPMAIFLSTKLGGNSETYSVPVSKNASMMFKPIRRELLYSGLFYEDLYQLK